MLTNVYIIYVYTFARITITNFCILILIDMSVNVDLMFIDIRVK